MAIGIRGKLNYLEKQGKTDGSILSSYNEVQGDYKELKYTYKQSKLKVKTAEEALRQAKESAKSMPLLKRMFKGRRKVKAAERKLKSAKIEETKIREEFKQKQKEYREFRKEIRTNYKTNEEYLKFFDRVKKAKEMGIALPKYIEDEYNNQSKQYCKEKYTVDKNGKKQTIHYDDKGCSKDIYSMILERKSQEMKEKVEKVKEAIKDKIFDGR